MENRIKELRKTLGLNQTDFGTRVGVKQTTVAGYESGARVPIDAVIASICREFNVNEHWLRTGEGEMFIPVSQDEEFIQMMTDIEVSNDDRIKKLISAYWKLPDEKKAVIWELIDSLK